MHSGLTRRSHGENLRSVLIADFSIDFWLALVGVVLGVIAIAIALHEGNRQINKMEAVRGELDRAVVDVKGEVATHYIGNYPDFMPEIFKTRAHARDSAA
jgi:hypothetical protein